MPPANGAQLAPPIAAHHCQPDERPPVRVLPCLGKDARSLGYRRRPSFRLRRGRRLDEVHRVDRNPLVAHGASECSTEDLVNVKDAGFLQRATLVRLAAAIAVMQSIRSVIGARSPIAVIVAAAKLGVERLDDLSIDSANLRGSDTRQDVLIGLTAVVLPRLRTEDPILHVPFDQLLNGGIGSRVTPLVDLGDELCPQRLSLIPGVRPGRDRLLQVQLLLLDRVDAGVHADPEGAGRQQVNPSRLALLRAGLLLHW